MGKKKEKKEVFNFRQALLDIGVSPQTADDWLEVRKMKKARNTFTAFKMLLREIELSGRTPEDCIAISAGNSWMGFKHDWIQSPRFGQSKLRNNIDLLNQLKV